MKNQIVFKAGSVNVSDDHGHLSLWLHLGKPGLMASVLMSAGPDEIVSVYRLYRALGHALEAWQPGLVNPVADSDPNYVDALKIHHEAQRLERGL